MKFIGNLINEDFKSKIRYILNDINMYMNVVFNFLYINKLFYLNLKSLKNNFISLTVLLSNKIKILNSSSLINAKVGESTNSLLSIFK